MSDQGGQDQERGAHLTADGIASMWKNFRDGNKPHCPSCGDDRVATAVDGALGVYRLVCVECGFSTPWFEVRRDGIRVHDDDSSPTEA